MKTPKIQWVDRGESFTKEELGDLKEVNWQSLEGRFHIHGMNDPDLPDRFTLEIREIRYGLKDQPNEVRIAKLQFPSVKAAKKFAQRRINHWINGKFGHADLEEADAKGGTI